MTRSEVGIKAYYTPLRIRKISDNNKKPFRSPFLLKQRLLLLLMLVGGMFVAVNLWLSIFLFYLPVKIWIIVMTILIIQFPRKRFRYTPSFMKKISTQREERVEILLRKETKTFFSVSCETLFLSCQNNQERLQNSFLIIVGQTMNC